MENDTSFLSQKITFQYLLKTVNDNGKYQKIMFLYFFIISLALSLNYANISFVFYSPDFYCLDKDGNSFKCEETVACANEHGYFVKSQRHSLTIDYQLYCDRKYIETLGKNFIFSIASIGCLLTSWLSDFLGRRILNIGGTFLMITGSILALSGKLYPSIVGIVFCFLGMDLLYNLIYTFGNENMGKKLRNRIVPLVVIFSVVVTITYSLICLSYQSYLLGFWFILFVIAICSVSNLYFVESPYFLNKKADKTALLEALKYINKINNKGQKMLEIESKLVEGVGELEMYERETDKSTKSISLFKTEILKFSNIRSILIASLFYMCSYTILGLMLVSLQNLGTKNLFFNQIFLNFIKSLYVIFLFFNFYKLKRKLVMMIFAVGSTVIPILLLLNDFVLPTGTLKTVISVILSIMLIAAAENVNVGMPIYLSEMLPTIIRGFGIGFNMLVARSSFIISNYLEILGSKHNINPLGYTCVIGIFCLLFVFSLEETLNKKLKT